MSVLLSVLFAQPATAMIGGSSDGDLHPNVGFIWIHSGLDRYLCSGTLVSETVVVTAAHCSGGDPEFTLDRVEVTFDPTVQVVRTETSFELVNQSIVGTPYFDARFAVELKNGGTSSFVERSNFDVGVIVLERPASEVFAGISPAPLPPRGLLDAYYKAKDQVFTSVGYGVTREAHENPHNVVFTGERLFALSPLKSLDPQILWLEGNPNNVQGTGGLCAGDSGGPVFLDSTIVAVHSFAMTPCHNLEGSIRLDSDAAREFLGQYVQMP